MEVRKTDTMKDLLASILIHADPGLNGEAEFIYKGERLTRSTKLVTSVIDLTDAVEIKAVTVMFSTRKD